MKKKKLWVRVLRLCVCPVVVLSTRPKFRKNLVNVNVIWCMIPVVLFFNFILINFSLKNHNLLFQQVTEQSNERNRLVGQSVRPYKWRPRQDTSPRRPRVLRVPKEANEHHNNCLINHIKFK